MLATNLVAALLAWAPPVEVQRPHEQPPSLALSWVTGGASECPTREAVIESIAAQGVEARMGDWVPSRHDAAELAVDVDVSIEDERWRANLRLTDSDGSSQRTFTAASCDALADATALIVAVTLDPVAVAVHSSALLVEAPEDPPPRSTPLPQPQPIPLLQPQPTETQPTETQPTRDRDPDEPDDTAPVAWPEALTLGVAVHGGGGWGPIAGLVGLLGGRVALLGARWRAELGGRWAIPRRLERDGGAGVFDAWVVEARGCFVPGVRRLELPLCPGIELGSVRGRGVTPTVDSTRRGFSWVAPSLSQGLNWAPSERLALGVELGLVVPLTRGRFIVGETTIGQLALVAGRALIILELRLP